MLNDVVLVWFHLVEQQLTATRAQLRAWMRELDLPLVGIGSPASTANEFVKAALNARIVYVRREDQVDPNTVEGVLESRNPEVVSIAGTSNDGRKLVELKWFAPRRTESGQVHGSHRIKHRLRTGLSGADTQAAEAWVSHVHELFGDDETLIPIPTIRRVAQILFADTTRCVPMPRTRSTYFTYGSYLPPVHPIGELLERVLENPEFRVIHVAGYAANEVFLASADVHLVEAFTTFAERVEAWMASRSPAKVKPDKAWREFSAINLRLRRELAEHETRLNGRLTQTRMLLEGTKEMMSRLEASAHLPGVSGR